MHEFRIREHNNTDLWNLLHIMCNVSRNLMLSNVFAQHGKPARLSRLCRCTGAVCLTSSALRLFRFQRRLLSNSRYFRRVPFLPPSFQNPEHFHGARSFLMWSRFEMLSWLRVSRCCYDSSSCHDLELHHMVSRSRFPCYQKNIYAERFWIIPVWR